MRAQTPGDSLVPGPIQPVITSFDAPGAGNGSGQGTAAGQITNDGTISGYYIDAQNVSHGFLRNAHGHIVSYDAPGAGTQNGQGTQIYSHAGGLFTGFYIDSSNVIHGFVATLGG